MSKAPEHSGFDPLEPLRPPDPVDPWGASTRARKPVALGASSRPTERLLTDLRGRVENGCPFDLARRACGITEAAHDAWIERGLAQHDARPDHTWREDGTLVLGGSLEQEAEYVRIFTTVQAGAAAKLVGHLWDIASDKGRKRDQLEAIKLLLRGMGEKAFDPRTESEVSVTAVDDRTGAADQAAIDAMTPEERRALTAAAREAAKAFASAEAAVAAAQHRTAATPVSGIAASVANANETPVMD